MMPSLNRLCTDNLKFLPVKVAVFFFSAVIIIMLSKCCLFLIRIFSTCVINFLMDFLLLKYLGW